MDEIDRANEINAVFQQESIQNRPRPKPIPLGSGECWHCKTTVQDTRRWCSATCRDQWELEHDDNAA